MKRWIFIVVACVCSSVSSGSFASDASVNYRVYVVTPTINNRVLSPDLPLPPTCKQSDRLALTACRGEYEPASFVIETPTPLEDAFVEVQPLVGEAGVVPSDAIDIRAVVPIFRRITDWPGTADWVLLHDPDLIVTTDDPQPLALVPDAPAHHRAYTKTTSFTREPVDTESLVASTIDKRRQFWVTVRVPEDAAAGTYEGKLVITASNAADRELSISVTVPDFDLLAPKFEYSVYHPVQALYETETEALKAAASDHRVHLSHQQYARELKNMLAHGCTNPNVYGETCILDEAGNLDISGLETILKLREEAGVPTTNLYLVNTGPINSSDTLNDADYDRNVQWVGEVVALAELYGYEQVYFMGADEATGEALTRQRRAWESVHDGGAKIFVAIDEGSYRSMSDLLDLPILIHSIASPLDSIGHDMPGKAFVAYGGKVRSTVNNHLLYPSKELTDEAHAIGNRIFTYMDPMAGYTLPDTHRRLRGLSMHLTGINGTMDWAYTHIVSAQNIKAGLLEGAGVFAFVARGKEDVFDTLGWEAFREGCDDARYLATLEAAIEAAKAEGRDAAVVAEAEGYLRGVSIHIDLDTWRQKMIELIEELQK